jgi:hypothetical protein
LPAASNINRPEGKAGSRGGRHVAGCAADTAVRNSPARKERRLSFELPISAHCRKNLLI